MSVQSVRAKRVLPSSATKNEIKNENKNENNNIKNEIKDQNNDQNDDKNDKKLNLKSNILTSPKSEIKSENKIKSPSVQTEKKKWNPSSTYYNKNDGNNGERGMASKGALLSSQLPNGTPNCFEVKNVLNWNIIL